MQDKPKKKKVKKESKIRDLKPGKDPKGGLPPGPCGPRGANRSISRDYSGNHNEVFLEDVS